MDKEQQDTEQNLVHYVKGLEEREVMACRGSAMVAEDRNIFLTNGMCAKFVGGKGRKAECFHLLPVFLVKGGALFRPGNMRVFIVKGKGANPTAFSPQVSVLLVQEREQYKGSNIGECKCECIILLVLISTLFIAPFCSIAHVLRFCSC
eukprot:m.39942 g.39942  ORF g.39942 m.39942 type:complete len:149 (-) comp10310_c0_seq15:2829-3275(-)